MKITICGSITFINEMKALQESLQKIGFEVFVPSGESEELTVEESERKKIENDLISDHYNKIVNSDCVLIANYDKNNIKGYIGGNSFLEIGFAFVNKKAVFVLNDIPEMIYSSEIKAMQPVVLYGNIQEMVKKLGVPKEGQKTEDAEQTTEAQVQTEQSQPGQAPTEEPQQATAPQAPTQQAQTPQQVEQAPPTQPSPGQPAAQNVSSPVQVQQTPQQPAQPTQEPSTQNAQASAQVAAAQPEQTSTEQASPQPEEVQPEQPTQQSPTS